MFPGVRPVFINFEGINIKVVISSAIKRHAVLKPYIVVLLAEEILAFIGETADYQMIFKVGEPIFFRNEDFEIALVLLFQLAVLNIKPYKEFG